MTVAPMSRSDCPATRNQNNYTPQNADDILLGTVRAAEQSHFGAGHAQMLDCARLAFAFKCFGGLNASQVNCLQKKKDATTKGFERVMIFGILGTHANG